MASETDMRLVAGVELVNLRGKLPSLRCPLQSVQLISIVVRVVDHLSPLHGKVDAQTISFVRRMFTDLQSWYREWYSIHRTKYDEESVLVKLLEAELVYAQLWTVCVALRGCAWDKVGRNYLRVWHKADIGIAASRAEGAGVPGERCSFALSGNLLAVSQFPGASEM